MHDSVQKSEDRAKQQCQRNGEPGSRQDCAPQANKARQKTTAQTDAVPSIDKSTDPIRMMNVMTIATINDGVDEIALRPMFRSVTKFGLTTVKATSISNGAHLINASCVTSGPPAHASRGTLTGRAIVSRAEVSPCPAGTATCRRYRRSTGPRSRSSHRSGLHPGTWP